MPFATRWLLCTTPTQPAQQHALPQAGEATGAFSKGPPSQQPGTGSKAARPNFPMLITLRILVIILHRISDIPALAKLTLCL